MFPLVVIGMEAAPVVPVVAKSVKWYWKMDDRAAAGRDGADDADVEHALADRAAVPRRAPCP
ncbi:hypothetical protein [Streptomyces sp. NPDC020996]|uniref:hypothetical protein n=1 Tax=Streptomyces sp. NPDC020996 TaxID=3154791 RepID=UPI0033E1D5C1